MNHLLDLERFPIDRPDSAETRSLIGRCRSELDADGMVNLEGFMRPEAVERSAREVQPLLDHRSFTHTRRHNVYFLTEVRGLRPDHPALREVESVNHTLCTDQLQDTAILRLYEWPPLADFIARVMRKPALHRMDDPLAGVNVIAYRAGECLNWHFDRSEFTTTLLLQASRSGGEFQYRSDLRSESDPNYDGVARLLSGEDDAVRTLAVAPGTLTIFKGRNTLHRVRPPVGSKDRIIAILSFYERPGVSFSAEERLGFYGRTQ